MPTTIPCWAKVTLSTLAPSSSSKRLNAVVTRIRASLLSTDRHREPTRRLGARHFPSLSLLESATERAGAPPGVPPRSEKNLEGEAFGAASLQQVDRPVEVDVVPRGERRRVPRAEACALELALPPSLDAIELVLLPDRGLE